MRLNQHIRVASQSLTASHVEPKALSRGMVRSPRWRGRSPWQPRDTRPSVAGDQGIQHVAGLDPAEGVAFAVHDQQGGPLRFHELGVDRAQRGVRVEGHRRIPWVDQAGHAPAAIADQEVEHWNVTGHPAGLIEHGQRPDPGPVPRPAG